MYFPNDCGSGNWDEILQDFMNDILKYEGHKLTEMLQLAIMTSIHEISHFINDRHCECHSQIPTILGYCERQLCHKTTACLLNIWMTEHRNN